MKDITVFTRSTCAPCGMIKRWLNYKGLSYREINVDENPDARQTAYEIAGYSIVPLVVVTKADGTRHAVAGYNVQALASLVA